MEEITVRTIEEWAEKSHAGSVSFGEVVGGLIQAGVESYYADYRRAATTYYLPDGSNHTIPLNIPPRAIPWDFDQPALLDAIRGAQRGAVKYPEFLDLSIGAGCVGYIVWIAGKHVSYFGRRGEVHLERFPQPG